MIKLGLRLWYQEDMRYGIKWVVSFGHVFGHKRQRRPRSDCASAQSDQGLHCRLTDSLGTIECINGEQRPGWDLRQCAE